MTDPEPKATPSTRPDKATSADKQQRLAEALRANLKRRKQQARQRDKPAGND